MIISIVGYAKSGKTSFAERLVREAASRALRVAAIKTGRSSHGGAEHASTGVLAYRDSERLHGAGAELTLFWSEQGCAVTGGALGAFHPTPLPDRDTFYRSWRSLLPLEVRRVLEETSLVVIEGRPVSGAEVVQMRKRSAPEAEALKYPISAGHTVVTDPHDFPRLIAALLSPLVHKEHLNAGTT